MKKAFLILLSIFLFFGVKSQNLMNIEPSFYVNDYENIFTSEQKDSLENILSEYEKKTSIEICVATSEDFDFVSNGDELAEKWGVGKKDLDNGLFIGFSRVQRIYTIRTGYGLEPFLPDGMLNSFTYDMKNSFREDDYYGGVKELINKVMNQLGTDGYEMLVENKKIREAEIKEKTKAFFVGLLKIIIISAILFLFVFIISIQIKKRRKFLTLKSEINKILNKIDNLKDTLGTLPVDVQMSYDRKIDKLTNKLVTNETRSSMQLIYNDMLAYTQIINKTESTIESIKGVKKTIDRYIRDNYPYCEDYLKNELNAILPITNIKQLESDSIYTRKRMNELRAIEASLEYKVNSFLNKTVKINNIVTDYHNNGKKIEKLNNQYSEYIRKKNILSGAKVGKRYDSLVNIDFNSYISKLSTSILDSFHFIENGDINSALSYYANYVTTLAVINGAFSKVDSLFNEYNKSVKFINDNKGEIDSLTSNIDSKLYKSGVSYRHKSDYAEIKNNIIKYKSAINTDIILAATLLTTIINSLNSVYRAIKSAISSHNSSSSYSSSYSSGSSYGSRSGGGNTGDPGGGGFGGFGGGSFGGGGVSGGF